MYIHDFTYSGNDITGAKSPERNRVGIKNNLSTEEAFSVQKHKQAIIDWIRNWIKKEKNVERHANKNRVKLGIHKLSGFIRKKNNAIIKANGKRVICSAMCWAKYLKKGFKGWIKYGETLPKRVSSSKVKTTQTTENSVSYTHLTLPTICSV